jgi:tetratricopeptide (TPR) repeat protein
MAAVETLFAQAVTHHRAGRLAEAGKLYQAVLAAAPEHAPALHLLGTLALEIGQGAAAIDLIAAAIAIDAGIAAYHNDLGEALRRAGRLDEAGEHYAQALALEPGSAAALCNLGLLAQSRGDHEMAIEQYRRALLLDPGLGVAQRNLGAALLESGELEAAAAELELAYERDPAHPAALLNLGNLRQAQDRYDEAIGLYRTLLATDPAHVPALINLAEALQRQGRPDLALPSFERALELAPDLPAAQWSTGLCRLLLGDDRRGWEGFAWRGRAGVVPPHGLPGPEWDGAPLDGKVLLVHAEQGLGDTIQFVRHLPALRVAAKGEIILLCQQPLARLLAPLARIATPDRALPAWDCRVPLLDLPRLLRARPTVSSPYLAGDAARVEDWRARLADLPRPRIGLVWRGRPEHKNDRRRSIPARLLAPLLQHQAGWVSLQQGAKPEELAALGPIRQLGDAFADLQDAAEAITALDLVISVDTALAHLTGALGRKLWLLLPLAPDWRWLTTRHDSPWYPSATLFRQQSAGDWAGVVSEVAASLQDLRLE